MASKDSNELLYIEGKGNMVCVCHEFHEQRIMFCALWKLINCTFICVTTSKLCNQSSQCVEHNILHLVIPMVRGLMQTHLAVNISSLNSYSTAEFCRQAEEGAFC